MNQFVNDIKTSKFFIQFGGQGVPWFKELKAFYQENSAMKHFFDTVFLTLEEEHRKIDNTAMFPQGFALQTWIKDDDAVIPDNDYLTIAPISLPMIFITQMAHIENLHTKGINRNVLLDSVIALTGHSQGIITATCVALTHNDDNFYETLSIFIRYMYYIGLRAQERYPSMFPSEKQKQDSLNLGIKDPSPMVAVLGESHDEIQKEVNIFNQNIDNEHQKIYIGLLNTKSNRILSSTPDSLIRFSQQIKEKIDSKILKYVYLKTTCPFHSPLLNSMLTPFLKDCRNIEFNYKGEDLRFPVYSFVDGSNLQDVASLDEILCKALMMQQLDWSKALLPLKSHSFDRVLDFGPGKVSQRLSLEVFSEIDLKIKHPLLAVASAKDLNLILKK